MRETMKQMMRMIVMILAGLVLMSGFGAQAAHAEERTCVGTLGAVTVDNLRVPAGKTCNLNKTYVKGTLKVERNATLNAQSIRVVGNIQAEGAKAVNVTAGSTVGGSIQVKQGGGALIQRVRVNGDIQFDANNRLLKALGNTVGGSIQVFQNKGGVEIANNTVDGNLQCKENTPRPLGGNNRVHGNKEDQCARL
jgi:hypothetical protein